MKSLKNYRGQHREKPRTLASILDPRSKNSDTSTRRLLSYVLERQFYVDLGYAETYREMENVGKEIADKLLEGLQTDKMFASHKKFFEYIFQSQH